MASRIEIKPPAARPSLKVALVSASLPYKRGTADCLTPLEMWTGLRRPDRFNNKRDYFKHALRVMRRAGQAADLRDGAFVLAAVREYAAQYFPALKYARGKLSEIPGDAVVIVPAGDDGMPEVAYKIPAGFYARNKSGWKLIAPPAGHYDYFTL